MRVLHFLLSDVAREETAENKISPTILLKSEDNIVKSFHMVPYRVNFSAFKTGSVDNLAVFQRSLGVFDAVSAVFQAPSSFIPCVQNLRNTHPSHLQIKPSASDL